MTRRRHSLVEDLIAITSKLPWWLGVVLALVSFAWLHSIAVSEVTAVVQPGKMGDIVGQSLIRTLASLGQYLLPIIFLLGAAVSAYGRAKRQALHAQVVASPDRGVLNDMSWQQFESVVGEAFRRKGYAVTETGGGGADDGVDLVLKKGSELSLVQCKQWKAYKVGVDTVRELYGVMAARAAAGGFVVTSGQFSNDARAFAEGRNIELIDGAALHALIRGVAVPVVSKAAASVESCAAVPDCPLCGATMTKRTAKRGSNAGNVFWGCIRYPDCKGTRAV